MRRLKRSSQFTAALLAVLAVTSVAAVGAAGRGNGASRSPVLALTARSPVAVAGRHFRPGARVRVTLTISRRWSQTVTPGAGGGFTVRFPATIDRCGSWSVTALQGAGRVVLRSGAKPMCAPLGAA